MGDDLNDLLEKAKAKYAAMTPEQRQQMQRDQRDSYTRAEAAFGTDVEEARDRADWASGDPARQAEAARREAERLARFDKMRRSPTILDQPTGYRLDVPTKGYGTGDGE